MGCGGEHRNRDGAVPAHAGIPLRRRLLIAGLLAGVGGAAHADRPGVEPERRPARRVAARTIDASDSTSQATSKNQTLRPGPLHGDQTSGGHASRIFGLVTADVRTYGRRLAADPGVPIGPQSPVGSALHGGVVCADLRFDYISQPIANSLVASCHSILDSPAFPLQ